MRQLRSHLTLSSVLLNILIALVYIVAGKLGLSLAVLNASATAVWAPTGIALAAVLFFGYRVIPGIFLGAFIVNNLTAGTHTTSLGIALGNTLEAICGAFLVKKFANGVHAFENIADLFKFTFFAAILSTMVSATIGVSTLVAGGLATWASFWSIWTTWWLGDMGGNLVIAPMLLVWGSFPLSKLSPKEALHLVGSFWVLLMVTVFVFTGMFPYAYLCIPIAIWIAFWFGQKGVTAATVLVAAIGIFYTLHHTGPFSEQTSLNQSLLLIQLFLAVFSITALTFSAAVSAIKKGEKTLISHQEKFQALIENSFDAIILIEANSKIVYASAAVKRLIGYEPAELVGTVGFDLVNDEDKARAMRELGSLVLRPKGVATIEYRSSRKDGEVIWVEATGTNLLFEPNVNAVVVNFRDITDKKMAQERILREKVTDEAMFASIGEGIVATDNQGRITMVNPATCEILGCEEKDLVGKLMVEAIQMQNKAGEAVDLADRPITKVLALGRGIITSPTYYYVRKDQTRVPIRFTLTPIILNDVVDGTIEVFYDTTKEKEVDKAKTEFVSLASHQLRTPLATINWYLEELIKKKTLGSVKQASYFEEVYHASHRMVALIDALLNASRLELGTFMVEPKKISLVKTVNEVLTNIHPLLQIKHLTVQKKYQETLPPISADPKFLTIIVQNLLSNAIKYSPENNQISLELSHTKKGFTIIVSDSGCGIPKNQQTQIFTKMFRADNARSLDPEGSGLGLYIVKAILDATGGTIEFHSTENKGTTFIVTFPNSGMQKKSGQKQLR